MSWTGHITSRAMKPYKKIVDDLKRTEMNKFNNGLNLGPKEKNETHL